MLFKVIDSTISISLYLSLFKATDSSVVNDGGEVTITDGGVNHRFVEIRLQSRIGEPLDYILVAYADYIQNSNITSSKNDI